MRKSSPSSSRVSARIDAVVRYRGATEGTLCVARCREISVTGLTARVDRPVFPGELVRFDLERAPGGPSVLGLARVSWVGADTDGTESIMRLRFLRVSDQGQALISNWIDEVSAVADRPSQAADDSAVRALSRAISDSLMPPAPRKSHPHDQPAPSTRASDAGRESLRDPAVRDSSARISGSANVLITPPPQAPTSTSTKTPTKTPAVRSVPETTTRLSATALSDRVRALRGDPTGRVSKPTVRLDQTPLRLDHTPLRIDLPPLSNRPRTGRVTISPPLPLGALIDAPADSARHSTPPGQRSATVPPAPPPAGLSSIPPRVPVSVGPYATSERVSTPASARMSSAPAPSISPNASASMPPSMSPPGVPAASIPIAGPDLPEASSPWTRPPSQADLKAHRKRGFPSGAPSWLVLCLASVTAGAAIAYFVYEPSQWIERALPIETPMHAGYAKRAAPHIEAAVKAAPTAALTTVAAAPIARLEPTAPPAPIAAPTQPENAAPNAIAEDDQELDAKSAFGVQQPGNMRTKTSMVSPLALLGSPIGSRSMMMRPAAGAKKKPAANAQPNVAAPVATPIVVKQTEAPPPPPALPQQLAPAATPAIEPTPSAVTAAPQSRLQRARACLAKGDNACAIALLQTGASNEAELELWIETLRADGRGVDARKQMRRYVNEFPAGRRAQTYLRILTN